MTTHATGLPAEELLRLQRAACDRWHKDPSPACPHCSQKMFRAMFDHEPRIEVRLP